MQRFIQSVTFIAFLVTSTFAWGSGENVSTNVPVFGWGKDMSKEHDYLSRLSITNLWNGVWKESTNGLRDQLQILHLKDGGSWLLVGVGSVKFNSAGDYVAPSNGKFSEFELRAANRAIVPPLAGTSLEYQCPPRIAIHDLPRYPNGVIKNILSFDTNVGPDRIAEVLLDNVYNILREDDYYLTVRPVIYSWGKNVDYVDRVDLPPLTIKIHLKVRGKGK